MPQDATTPTSDANVRVNTEGLQTGSDAPRSDSEMAALGKRYLDGDGVKVNVGTAIRWYRKAAKADRRWEQGLCNALLCSDSPDRHAEALGIAEKNAGEAWAKKLLSTMYY